MSSHTLIGAILVFVLGIVGGEERCNCNFITHPQAQFCQSTFALQGVILGAHLAPAPGDPDLGDITNKYLRYDVGVVEVYKGSEFLRSGETVSIYAPRFKLCTLTGLYDEEGANHYLIAGDNSTSSSSREEFLVVTNCNWILPWQDVTPEQEQGLLGAYSECGEPCPIRVAATPLQVVGATDADKFSHEQCIFNPIGAQQMLVPDCETDHGVCQGCRWVSTPAYEECYASRRDQLSNGAAAITTKKGCSQLSGKMKKKCLLKLFKSRSN